MTSLTMLLLFRARKVKASSLGLSSTSRITLLSISCLPGIWEGEIKGRPFIHGPLGPDASAVSGNDALHGREADAGAFELPGCMQALERAKQFVGIRHVESRAVITDKIKALAVLPVPAKTDLCLFAMRTELQGVTQQVGEHDSEQALVAPGHESLFYFDRHIPFPI